MCVVNATPLLKRTLQWEIWQSGPVVAVKGGCMLIVSVRLLSTVMVATECVQIVFYNFTSMYVNALLIIICDKSFLIILCIENGLISLTGGFEEKSLLFDY